MKYLGEQEEKNLEPILLLSLPPCPHLLLRLFILHSKLWWQTSLAGAHNDRLEPFQTTLGTPKRLSMHLRDHNAPTALCNQAQLRCRVYRHPSFLYI